MTGQPPIDPRITALATIADLLRDRDLAQLAQAGRAVAAMDRHLAALDHTVEMAPDVAAALAQQRYAIWADTRRRLLQPERDRLEGARQSAAESARLSFGRALVLKRMRDQLS